MPYRAARWSGRVLVVLLAGAAGCSGDNLTPPPTDGALEIRTTTTGTAMDPDGYMVQVDGGTAQAIGVNTTLPIAGVAAGAHQVALSGLATNCAVQGDNSQPVTVTAGATASVAFTVSCRSPGGSSWTPMVSGTAVTLLHVTGTSPTNVFAATENTCSAQDCAMSILHYDGAAWSSQLTDFGRINDFWAAADGQVFAARVGPIDQPISILHYNGQGWSSPAAQPAFPSEETTLNGIWGSSPTDVYAVGYWISSSGNSFGYILHFDGAQWSEMAIANADKGNFLHLTDVWGSSATDVYAIGEYQPEDSELSDFRGVILHYDGQAWTEVFRQADTDLKHIWGTAATDVYVTGAQGQTGAIWHYDGQQWAPLSIPAARTLEAIWGSSSRDIYVLQVADAPFYASPDLLHFDGSEWTVIHTGSPGLLDVWGSSAADVFLVGADGTILHGP